MDQNRQRLNELLRRSRRAMRIPVVVEAWRAIGVSASPLSADHQANLICRLRAAGLRRSNKLPLASSNTLSHEVGKFARPLDMLVVVGWDADEGPAILLSAEACYRAVGHLRSMYPDGLLLLDQPFTAALAIDFDEGHLPTFYVDHLSIATE